MLNKNAKVNHRFHPKIAVEWFTAVGRLLSQVNQAFRILTGGRSGDAGGRVECLALTWTNSLEDHNF